MEVTEVMKTKFTIFITFIIDYREGLVLIFSIEFFDRRSRRCAATVKESLIELEDIHSKELSRGTQKLLISKKFSKDIFLELLKDPTTSIVKKKECSTSLFQ